MALAHRHVDRLVDDRDIAARIVEQVEFAATGDGNRVGDSCWRVDRHIHRKRQRREVCAASHRQIVRGRGWSKTRLGPANSSNRSGRQPRGQGVDNGDETVGGHRARISHCDCVCVARVALMKITHVCFYNGQIRGAFRAGTRARNSCGRGRDYDSSVARRCAICGECCSSSSRRTRANIGG